MSPVKMATFAINFARIWDKIGEQDALLFAKDQLGEDSDQWPEDIHEYVEEAFKRYGYIFASIRDDAEDEYRARAVFKDYQSC